MERLAGNVATDWLQKLAAAAVSAPSFLTLASNNVIQGGVF
jgi:hypothetical protein